MMEFKIADNAARILFGQFSNDLIDDLAVSLALQLSHNSLHDLTLIFRSQNICEFLFQNSFHFFGGKHLGSKLAHDLVALFVFFQQLGTLCGAGVDLFFYGLDLFYKVMRIRTCLDYLAAFNFLLQGHWDNASAVMRARKEYKRLCPSFSLSREENMRKKTLNPIPERTKSSILWQFYARGCKRFSQLSDLKG